MTMATARPTWHLVSVPSGPVAKVRRRSIERSTRPSPRDRLQSFEHFLAGWRDGRRGLPVPEQARLTRLQQLQHLLDTECERLHREYVDATEVHELALADLRPELERARLRLSEAEDRLAAHRRRPADASAQFGEHRMPSELVAIRRAREYRRRESELEEQRRRHRNYLFELLSQVQTHQSRVEQELERARAGARAARARHGTWLRAYVRGAERTHYDPPALLAAIDHLELTVPAWVTEQPTFGPNPTSQKAA